jgi:hypothetical protein
MASGFYSSYARALFDPATAVDLIDDTIKVLLVTAAYNFTPATHDFLDDITGEVVGTGYATGGLTLAGKAVTATAANSWGTSWANSTVYAAQKVVRPTVGNGYVYMCVVDGTSGGSEPTWPTTIGDTVTDGTTKWVCVGTRIVQFTASNPSWPTSSITARGAVIYKSTGVAGTSPLIRYVDFGSNFTSTNGTFQVTWAADGVFYMPVQ